MQSALSAGEAAVCVAGEETVSDYRSDEYEAERRWFPNALFGKPAVECLLIFGSVIAALLLVAIIRSRLVHGGTVITL